MSGRLVITGDVLRPNPDGRPINQARNLRWLAGWLEPLLAAAAPGVPVDRVMDEADGLAFYAACGRTSGRDAWIELVAADVLPAAADDWFAARFADAVIVGYELPPSLVALATRHAVPCVNLTIHPLRFLDDLVLGVLTNRAELAGILAAHRLGEAAVAAGVAHCREFFAGRPAPVEPGALLVVGQTRIDRSLVHAGRLWGLGDFTDRLTELAAAHPHTCYKAHPVDPVPLAGIAAAPCTTNIYHLLAHGRLATVVAVSSGVLEEAAAFGVRAVRLLPAAPPAWAPVPAAASNARFWAELLAPLLPTDRQTDLTLPAGPNRLREELGWYWGYRELAAPSPRWRWWWPFGRR